MRFAWLAALAALVALMLAVVGYDLITRPADLWVAGTFLAGTLTGAALDRHRPR